MPRDGTPDIRVQGLTKRYGDVVAVDAIDLDIFAERGGTFEIALRTGSTRVDRQRAALDPLSRRRPLPDRRQRRGGPGARRGAIGAPGVLAKVQRRGRLEGDGPGRWGRLVVTSTIKHRSK